MPDDTESGARWWFKNVIVPLLGSGGVLAVLIAWYLGQHKDPPSPPTPNAVNYTIRIKSDPVTEAKRAYFSLDVFVDNKLVGVLSSNENAVVDTINATAPTAGAHDYLIRGRVQPYQQASQPAAGSGKIVITDNAIFGVEPVKAPPNNPTMILALFKHQ